MAKGASSPIGRGLVALASEASLGEVRGSDLSGEGSPSGLGVSVPRIKSGPCDAKAESPLPMGEEFKSHM